MSLELFKSPLIKLETLIRKLEINTGQPHRQSPFEGIVKPEFPPEKPAPQIVKEQQIEKKEQQEQVQQQEKKEVANPKQEKQQQQKQQQPAKPKPQVPQPGPQIPPEYQDIANIDIRVGEFVKVWKHPESENLYCEQINIGTEVREIASGLQKYIPIEEVTGLCLVLANLKGRKLAGFMSNGMVLCASNADHTKIEILKPAPGSVVGERVKIQGKEEYFNDALEKELNPKKKNWENAQPLLKVDQQLQATWNGQLLITSAGPIKAQTLADGSIS